MRDMDLLFIILALYNTNLGMTNSEKNESQAELLKQIDGKLDELLETMANER